MGEVYRATDSRLSRDVAIKVLPLAFAIDADRLRRFDQEARAAGQLNHPNILAVFDAGMSNGAPYVVTELLEGQTLRERLSHGPLPPRRVIETGIQIAHGLAAAHDHGIVHRDLKPENLFVTHDGRVKILDFGLAKLTRSEGAALREYDSLAGTMTQTGVILGTAGYMAPEQVRGQPADHRADLFSLGAILYEMVTGCRAFQGETAIDTLGAILHADPADIAQSSAAIPQGLDRVIRHCLEKRPEQRFQSARDVVFALEALSGESLAGKATAVRRAPWNWRTIAVPVAAAVLAAALAAIVAPRLVARSAHRPTVRFSLPAPPGTAYVGNGGSIAVSPDGQLLAFRASDSAGTSHIWVRPLDSFSSHMLPGTEAAFLPFWSPDSRNVGFFIEGKMKRIAVDGATPNLICKSVSGRGGTWNRRGMILFAPTPSGPLFKVPASGGDPVQVTALDTTRHETAHRFPVFLTDGRHFIFIALPPHSGGYDVCVGSIDSKAVRHAARTEYGASFAPDGWLLTGKNNDLIAQRFDPHRLAPTGDPRSIGKLPPSTLYDAEPPASVSSNGVLAAYSQELVRTTLTWLDRTGRTLSVVPIPPGRYEDLALSPDGRRAATMLRSTASSLDCWVVDLARGVATRVTFDESSKSSPLWMPDGLHLLYCSNRGGAYDFYSKLASGVGEEQLFYHSADLFKVPIGWTREGKTFLFHRLDSRTAWDLWSLRLGDNRAWGQPTPVLHGSFNEIPSALSPNGDWMAYMSDESGTSQLYVASFPDQSRRFQISTGGANNLPLGVTLYWTRGGEELIYGGADGLSVMSVSVPRGDPSGAGTPHLLFRFPPGTLGVQVTADGQRFLATVPVAGAEAMTARVIVGWNTSFTH